MRMSPEQAVAGAMLLCAGGAVLSLGLSSRKTAAGWVAFVVVALSSLLVLFGVGTVLASGPGPAWTVLRLPALGFALRLSVDGLSALFLGLIATVTVPAALYSIAYIRSHDQHGSGGYYPNLLLFVAAMYGLVSTTDMMWFFFIFWQLMTWTGWALIRYERLKPENVRAANKYMGMMQLACGATMLGAGLLAGGDVRVVNGETLLPYDFEAVADHLPELLHARGAWAANAFGLFLIGFGIKLGMWPFGQIWLPDAHPAAPSPVSALLSGVMIKTGVYGLMRYFIWLVPLEAQRNYPMENWGVIIALLGTITLFTGTMSALQQDQSKRLLAFSSIGQGGYILLGLGACLALLPSNPTLAAAAFYGAMFHTLNHAVFKSLLFLNAGSVLHATGTQDLNKLGGLVKFMPVTAVTACVGALAIAGVPLLNGFASKWTISVAAIQGGTAAKLLPACALVAILTSAITLALFLKFFGGIFLSRQSLLVTQRTARQPSLEVGWYMGLPQAALASLCVVMGLAPFLVVALIYRALDVSRQGLAKSLAETLPFLPAPWLGINPEFLKATYVPCYVLLILGLAVVMTRAVSKLGGSRRRPAAPWLCGYARQAECHRYQAGGLYAEVKRLFNWVGGAPRRLPDPPQPSPNPRP